MASLKLHWRSISGSAVPMLGVVEHLDVVEDAGPCVIAARVRLAADALTPEQRKEALGHSVVVTAPPQLLCGSQRATPQLAAVFSSIGHWRTSFIGGNKPHRGDRK